MLVQDLSGERKTIDLLPVDFWCLAHACAPCGSSLRLTVQVESSLAMLARNPLHSLERRELVHSCVNRAFSGLGNCATGD